jgi:hypothetical protein
MGVIDPVLNRGLSHFFNFIASRQKNGENDPRRHLSPPNRSMEKILYNHRGVACRIRLDGPAGSHPFEKVAKHGKKGSINTF